MPTVPEGKGGLEKIISKIIFECGTLAENISKKYF
jgi:hypothetical protein